MFRAASFWAFSWKLPPRKLPFGLIPLVFYWGIVIVFLSGASPKRSLATNSRKLAQLATANGSPSLPFRRPGSFHGIAHGEGYSFFFPPPRRAGVWFLAASPRAVCQVASCALSSERCCWRVGCCAPQRLGSLCSLFLEKNKVRKKGAGSLKTGLLFSAHSVHGFWGWHPPLRG